MTIEEKLGLACAIHNSIGEKVELIEEILKESKSALQNATSISEETKQKMALSDQLINDNIESFKKLDQLMKEIDDELGKVNSECEEGEEWKGII